MKLTNKEIIKHVDSMELTNEEIIKYGDSMNKTFEEIILATGVYKDTVMKILGNKKHLDSYVEAEKGDPSFFTAFVNLLKTTVELKECLDIGKIIVSEFKECDEAGRPCILGDFPIDDLDWF